MKGRLISFIFLTIIGQIALNSAYATSDQDIINTCFNKEESITKDNLHFSKKSNFHLQTKIEDDLNLSVINENQAQQIFNILANKKYIPYGYAKMGCEARAHEMARIMDEMCLKTAKAFLIGKISYKSISWAHHVAPILLVNKDGVTKPYIFDPSVFDEAVPLSDWSEKLKSFLGHYNLAITNQYVYRPEDINNELTDYRIRDLVKTKAGLTLFSIYHGFNSIPDATVNILKKIID